MRTFRLYHCLSQSCKICDPTVTIIEGHGKDAPLSKICPQACTAR